MFCCFTFIICKIESQSKFEIKISSERIDNPEVSVRKRKFGKKTIPYKADHSPKINKQPSKSNRKNFSTKCYL